METRSYVSQDLACLSRHHGSAWLTTSKIPSHCLFFLIFTLHKSLGPPFSGGVVAGAVVKHPNFLQNAMPTFRLGQLVKQSSLPGYHILLCIMHTFLPKFLREKQRYALYMGLMITYHGYHNPTYNEHKNMDAHYTCQVQYFQCPPSQSLPGSKQLPPEAQFWEGGSVSVEWAQHLPVSLSPCSMLLCPIRGHWKPFTF